MISNNSKNNGFDTTSSRVTCLGSFLRSKYLDQILSVINILASQISFLGLYNCYKYL